MIPQVIVLDFIPLLVNGKIDRQSLLKMYENTNNNDDSSIIVDIDYSGIPDNKMAAAKVLFETVGNVIGRSTRAPLSKYSNFYELGGNSLNSVFTVTQLRDSGYFIGITDFITAENLGEVLDRITGSDTGLADTKLTASYTSAPLAKEHKEDVYQMVTNSFYEKADLEQWLMPNIYKTDYAEILDAIWDALIEKGLSFVVKDKSGENVGVALNFDARGEPEVEVTSKLLIVFEFLEHIEGPVRDERLPSGINTVFHSFMMATASKLTAQQNISVMQFMEAEVLRTATSRGFKGILTTNTSPLTQQLGTDVYGYTVMTDYQVNQYVAPDGSKPFGAAPDSQRAAVSWKAIN
uniref:Putative non-ribosomal peptide synthetase/alpha-aminoadipate reductase n=1 Tax=Xenopsylla cheopis TaxID=163159 RepID=A0A6M2DYW7_XENCH